MSALRLKYQRLKKQKRRNIILNSVCLLIAASGLIWTGNYFWRYINYEITNDAFIDQYIAPVNIRVAGYIQDVRFKEHQYVKQGDTLVVLDNHEYLIRQKEAQAALLDAQGSREVLSSGIQTSHTRIAEQEANLAEAKAKLWQAEQVSTVTNVCFGKSLFPSSSTMWPKPTSMLQKHDTMPCFARKKLHTHSTTKPIKNRPVWKLESYGRSCTGPGQSESIIYSCHSSLQRLHG